jgi:hypothetical protein
MSLNVAKTEATPALRGSCASDHLDLMRGLAAVAVVYSHARVLLLASLDR